jgi:hypothetical protein
MKRNLRSHHDVDQELVKPSSRALVFSETTSKKLIVVRTVTIESDHEARVDQNLSVSHGVEVALADLSKHNSGTPISYSCLFHIPVYLALLLSTSSTSHMAGLIEREYRVSQFEAPITSLPSAYRRLFVWFFFPTRLTEPAKEKESGQLRFSSAILSSLQRQNILRPPNVSQSPF